MQEVLGGPVWHHSSPKNQLGESPVFRSRDSTLHWIDMLSTPCRIHILSLDPETLSPLGPERILVIKNNISLSVICFRQDFSGYIVGYRHGIGFLDEETGEVEIIKRLIPDGELDWWCNDGAIDPMGRFWIGEVDLGVLNQSVKGEKIEGIPRGRLWMYDGISGKLEIMERGIGCGNGMGWSRDGKSFFLNDSAAQTVAKYDFDSPTGKISNKSIIVKGGITQGVMNDGMVIDEKDNLWIAMWMDHSIRVYSSEGLLLKRIVFPAKCITCPTWGGTGLDTLFITSGIPLVEPQAEGDEGGNLFRYSERGVKGLKKFEFVGSGGRARNNREKL